MALHNKHTGQSLVEYALILSLVAVVGASSLGPLGTTVAAKFDGVRGAMNAGSEAMDPLQPISETQEYLTAEEPPVL